MKKFYLLVFASVVFIGTSFSQAKLENYKHTFKPGDEHHFFITNKVEEGPAGKGVVWDFTDLKKQGDLKSHMLLTSEVENTGKIPEANIILEEYGTHFYFRMAGNSMKHYGTVTKNNTILKYDKPFVKMIYPFEFGQSKKGTYSGEIQTSDNKKKFKGNYHIEVDGYGDLILPGDIKIKDVLRLKTVKEKTYENSSYTSVIESYKWYCQDVRYPLLTVIKSGKPGKTKTIKTAYYADAEMLSVNNNKNPANREGYAVIEGEVNAYPNPFEEQFNVDYTLGKKGDVDIIIFDNSGRKIKDIHLKNQPRGNYQRTIKADGNNFTNGLYHITIKVNNQDIKKRLLKVE
jgi:hypothetical protein